MVTCSPGEETRVTTDDRTHRPQQDQGAGAIARWARAAIGAGGDPPLPRPRPIRVEPVRRSWIAAFWQARIAVRAGMTLDDFLRSRLARYLAGLPVPGSRLPLAIDVDDGRLAVRTAPEPARQAPAADGVEPWLAPLVALEGPAVRQEVAELEVRLALLEGEIEAARHRTEELSRRVAADVAAGIVAGPPEVEATAEQLGRPPVRSVAPRSTALGFAAVALAAETWQVAQPILRWSGIDPAALAAEAAARPVEVTFGSVFALGVAVGVFALAWSALGAGIMLFRDDADERRRRWLAACSVGAGTLAVMITAAVAALPVAGGGAPARAPFVLLLLAVPLAAALAMRAARRQEEQRALELAAALAWDRERARALGERARRLEELDWADEEARRLERQRDAARRRVKEINARAIAAARLGVESDRHERAALARLAQSVVGALELDRYEFVRQATARGARELLSPRRRGAAEVRPSFDEATAPVAAPAVEAGRLAS
jgi:hypothetical protein